MENTRLVYSDEFGTHCPKCGKPRRKCTCKTSSAPVPDGIVRVGRQSKGRKGKGVTLISGVPLAGAELKVLAKELKQKCGTGGTVKEGVIEIQGDHRDDLISLLSERGWKVKRSGG